MAREVKNENGTLTLADLTPGEWISIRARVSNVGDPWRPHDVPIILRGSQGDSMVWVDLSHVDSTASAPKTWMRCPSAFPHTVLVGAAEVAVLLRCEHGEEHVGRHRAHGPDPISWSDSDSGHVSLAEG